MVHIATAVSVHGGGAVTSPSLHLDGGEFLSKPLSPKREYQFQCMQWAAMMVGCARAMPKRELAELEKWEQENIDGCTGTNDWPGWAKYIGKCPQPPESITSFKKAKKSPIPMGLRIAVWRRDNFLCVKCGSSENLQIDHKFPVSKGGPSTLENLQTLCRTCNIRKGKK